ncbi:MAG: hypothetical protein A4E66_00654 [Syntrophus sp. PtaB.Bin001]|nr:MAG: hypothetical protein A4E66_00654 [Syntrophus sp. PtaB.Bin001]
MNNPFFEHPVLNSPYFYPAHHWELDDQGQPTRKMIENRRRAEFITPIPKPEKGKGSSGQQSLIIDEGKGLSSQSRPYDPTPKDAISKEMRKRETRSGRRSSSAPSPAPSKSPAPAVAP